MNDIYKCVITPAVRTYTLRSSKWKVGQGPHIIEDHTKTPVTRRIIRPGTEAIECLQRDKRGHWRVVETNLPGGIVVKGKMPGVRRKTK